MEAKEADVNTSEKTEIFKCDDVLPMSARERRLSTAPSEIKDELKQIQELPQPLMVRRSSVGSNTIPSHRTSWSMQSYLRSNAKINRLVQAALLQTLIHAIRSGSVEGVRVAIERGVHVQYINSRRRNLLMFAMECDTDARLPIVIILSDAGCDINHVDVLGWSCLHFACATGAYDVAMELVRRGAHVEYNPYGYGPEDFIIPKVIKAKSLLQHTEQLQHEKNVQRCWSFLRQQAEASGYSVSCRSHCDLGEPLKVSFQAPVGHSPLDRIRIVDVNTNVALWLQVSKTFPIPPGQVGSITLDIETLDRPSLYRIFYEKYEPTPMEVPIEIAENSLCVRNLDTGRTLSMGDVNEVVLKELESTRARRDTIKLTNSSREAPDSTTCRSSRRLIQSGRHGIESERESSDAESNDIAEEEKEQVVEHFSNSSTPMGETLTVANIDQHPAVHSITGVYRIVAMTIVSVSTLNDAKANEYEIMIRKPGPIGLHLDTKTDTVSRATKLIVRRSTGQAAAVNPGDCLVAVGNTNIEHAGLRHTLWELNEVNRPMALRFRRGTPKEKRSLFTSIRKLSGTKSIAAIVV